jgi:hypothetical protein
MDLRPQTSAPLRSRSIPVPSFYPAVLALGLAILVCSGHAVAGCTLKGQGTAKSPYLVGTLSDLLQVADTCGDSASYRMTADIDASASALTPLTGTVTFKPLGGAGGFSGQFHGAGHIIQNISFGAINVSYVQLSGLFEQTNNSAVIDSLGFTNALITVDPTGIISCAAFGCGSLLASTNGSGAISGINKGKISNCYLTGRIIYPDLTLHNDSVNGPHPGIIYAPRNAGGIAGVNQGHIINCYVIDTVGGVYIDSRPEQRNHFQRKPQRLLLDYNNRFPDHQRIPWSRGQFHRAHPESNGAKRELQRIQLRAGFSLDHRRRQELPPTEASWWLGKNFRSVWINEPFDVPRCGVATRSVAARSVFYPPTS